MGRAGFGAKQVSSCERAHLLRAPARSRTLEDLDRLLDRDRVLHRQELHAAIMRTSQRPSVRNAPVPRTRAWAGDAREIRARHTSRPAGQPGIGSIARIMTGPPVGCTARLPAVTAKFCVGRERGATGVRSQSHEFRPCSRALPPQRRRTGPRFSCMASGTSVTDWLCIPACGGCPYGGWPYGCCWP